uniref:Uncharacterized protein n=1 Tax=Heterorhabditis bacteriophora TaxID=37862 RepID=A0A1I7WJL6_HETBA
MVEVRKWIDDFIASKLMSFFNERIRKLPERWQKLCTIFTAVVPFIGLFFMKMVFDNFMPIFRVGTALFGFLVIDYRVQALITAGKVSIFMLYCFKIITNLDSITPTLNCFTYLILSYSLSDFWSIRLT